jgi:glycosyltransferase involved in cell wall biosynthesis
MKSVLLVGSKRGGVGRFIQNMVKGFEKSGVKCDVHFLDHFPFKRAESDGISFYRLKAPLFMLNTLLFALKTVKYLKKYDIIHTNYAIPTLIAYFCVGKRRKIIYTIHGPPRPWIEDSLLDKIYYAMELTIGRFIAKKVNVVTISNYSRLMLIKLLGINCKVIYNGIDTSFFTPASDVRAERNKLKLPLESFIVLYVGRFVSLKKPQNVLKAALTFTPEFVKRNKIYLIFIGKGPLYKELLELSRSFAGVVRFLSDLTHIELRSYYRAANVLVMPSIGEPFGYSTLEAMSCGLPVIADSSGATPELLGEYGIYYKSDNYVDLAIKLQQLIEERMVLFELGRKLRMKAISFDYIETIAEYLKLY